MYGNHRPYTSTSCQLLLSSSVQHFAQIKKNTQLTTTWNFKSMLI